jgi:hypothetical protein
MFQPLTPEQAQDIFDKMASRGDEIAFLWLAEGCESRAQVMIEQMQGMGLDVGRAWAATVSKPLVGRNPDNPREGYPWRNHVAPTVSVAGIEHGVLVIDPSLSRTGPLTLPEWAKIMGVKNYEISTSGMSEVELQARHVALGNRGGLDAMLFNLKLTEPPIPEAGGSGFMIGPDPAVDLSDFAREEMKGFLQSQNRRQGKRP